MDHILFIHSPRHGLWDCFQCLAIKDNSLVNIYVQVFVWTYIFSQVDLGMEISGSYGKYKLTF